MSRVIKIVCDVCGSTDDEALYLVGSDAADIHLCNYCLDQMNQRAIEHLESCERDIDFKEGTGNEKFQVD